MKQQLKQALILAQSRFHQHPQFQHYLHWSFVVQGGKLIEWGTNREASPPKHFGYHHHSKIHSELDAYKKARGLLNPGPFALINIRLSRRGELRMSAPCPTCAEWLRSVGCDQVWFSTPSGWARLKF